MVDTISWAGSPEMHLSMALYKPSSSIPSRFPVFFTPVSEFEEMFSGIARPAFKSMLEFLPRLPAAMTVTKLKQTLSNPKLLMVNVSSQQQRAN